MSQITAPEALFLQEHLRASQAMLQLIRMASRTLEDPELKQLCSRIAQEDQNGMQSLTRLVSPGMPM